MCTPLGTQLLLSVITAGLFGGITIKWSIQFFPVLARVDRASVPGVRQHCEATRVSGVCVEHESRMRFSWQKVHL